jgi:hypothetical protein
VEGQRRRHHRRHGQHLQAVRGRGGQDRQRHGHRSKAGYNTAAKTSALTARVAVGTLTAPVPKITGTVKVGYTLTAVPGAWGPAPVVLK